MHNAAKEQGTTMYFLGIHTYQNGEASMKFLFAETGLSLFLIGRGVLSSNHLSVTIQESNALVHHEIADENLVEPVEAFAEGEKPGEKKEEALENVDDDHGTEEELDGERVYEVVNGGLFLGMHLLQPEVLLMQMGAEIAAVEDGEVEEESGGEGEFPAVGSDEELAEEGNAEVEGNGHGDLDAEEETVGDYEEDGGEPGKGEFQEAGHEENRAVGVGDDGEEKPKLGQPWLVGAVQRCHSFLHGNENGNGKLGWGSSEFGFLMHGVFGLE
ncbi:UNVERIFIED_CONTAM: hypothetical protein Sindi_1969400 [Sesamum indicum]